MVPKADLGLVLDAYAVLEVEHKATPRQIHAAFRLLAYHHHPDRLPPGSTPAERVAANDRMARLNAAYSLIRDAPLRHSRIGNDSQTDWSTVETQLEQVLQQARRRRRRQQVSVIFGFGALSLVAALELGPALVRLGFARETAGLLIAALIAFAWIVRSRDPWWAINTAVDFLRLLVIR
jgi:hypothetical protein